MDYLQRQFRLSKFIHLLKYILSDKNLATDRLPKNSFLEKIKNVYFLQNSPLENKKNKTIFPKATKQFAESLKNGHSLDSMKKNLNFLNSEFDSYFDDLIEKRVLKTDNGDPPAYRLNHNSAMVYWIIGAGIAFSFLLQIIKIFVSINQNKIVFD